MIAIVGGRPPQPDLREPGDSDHWEGCHRTVTPYLGCPEEKRRCAPHSTWASPSTAYCLPPTPLCLLLYIRVCAPDALAFSFVPRINTRPASGRCTSEPIVALMVLSNHRGFQDGEDKEKDACGVRRASPLFFGMTRSRGYRDLTSFPMVVGSQAKPAPRRGIAKAIASRFPEPSGKRPRG